MRTSTSTIPIVKKVASDERPLEYAFRVGKEYLATTSPEHSSELGQYFTPKEVAGFMAKLFQPRDLHTLRILDPGAGVGMLSAGLLQTISEWPSKPDTIQLITYEIDKGVIPHLEKTLLYLKGWAKRNDIKLSFEIRTDDFVLKNASALHRFDQTLFRPNDLDLFDLVISNPPYFKISKSDPRAKAAEKIIHGQPNIYALFMMVSAQLLDDGGEICFITPRSYTAGPYFKRFREHLFARLQPLNVHLFEARNKVFGESSVLQENIILHAGHKEAFSDNNELKISVSESVESLNNRKILKVDLKDVIGSLEEGSIFHTPVNSVEQEVMRVVRSWEGSLHSFGMEISTGPVVAFRVEEYLTGDANEKQNLAPLLWIQHVTAMSITWPLKLRKPEFLRTSHTAKSLMVPNKNYVLLRRFSTKEDNRRIVAAPFLRKQFESEVIGIENHLNYIYYRVGDLSQEEAYGLATILNCSLIDTYFRTSNGNTQVSATELRQMPLPPLSIIKKIGSRVSSSQESLSMIDEWVTSLLMKTYA